MYAGLSPPPFCTIEWGIPSGRCLHVFLMAHGSIHSSPQLEYKKGHEERISKYTTFVDPPEVLLAKKQGQIVSDVSSTEQISK